MPNSTGDVPSVVNVYIDGYNFYYSISRRDAPELLPLGWCNFGVLADRLVRRTWPAARVGAIKYYTSPVRKPVELHVKEGERQRLWLDALLAGTKGRVRVIEGYHVRDDRKGRVEKQTDVNLAVGMVRDAIMAPADARHGTSVLQDQFSHCDGVILISADKDFLPAVRLVAAYGTKMAIFRPLGHEDDRWDLPDKAVVSDLTEEDLQRSRLPERIVRDDGRAITWARYLELKSAAKSVQLKVPPPDSVFDGQCQDACQREASRSIDKDTQVGCLVVSPDGNTKVRGHNALPAGISAILPARLSRPTKYSWIEHAERNAIYAAAHDGISLAGCIMYVDLTPCVDCARGIVQAGIKEVVVSKQRMLAYSNPTFREQHTIATTILHEAGVSVRSA